MDSVLSSSSGERFFFLPVFCLPFDFPWPFLCFFSPFVFPWPFLCFFLPGCSAFFFGFEP